MIASNVSADTLKHAADTLGLTLDMAPLNVKGTRHRVKVNLGRNYRTPEIALTRFGNRRKGAAGDYAYQRYSASAFAKDGRRVFAVCWHGFRDFFREVYKHEPNAVFQTAMETWRGSVDFEARHEQSASKNIGAPVRPVCAADACGCERD